MSALMVFGTHSSLRGLMLPPPEALTAEGYDMTFGTSVLGQLLTPGAAEIS